MSIASVEQMTDILTSSARRSVNISERVASLRNRYEEPWRHYHTFEHPREMFGVLLDNQGLVSNIGAVAWAIMYHDAVYDPEAAHGRNEELSARLAEHELPAVVDASIVSQVAHYTRETVHHTTGADDSDRDIFMDIDLTILGAPRERYARYVTDVRREYAHVSDTDYRLGRIAVLENLASRVERRGLFRTRAFAEVYEERAQENIAGEIDALRRARE